MKRNEIIREVTDPQANQHTPRIDLRMIQSMMDALRELPPDVANSLADSGLAEGSGLVVLGAVGDPDIAGRMRTEIGREMGKSGMRTADDEVQIRGGAESGDEGYARIEGYFDWSTMEVAFRSEYIQQILRGEAIPEVANTVIHEMLHRALYIVDTLPEFQSIIPNDLKTVWAGGWGDINWARYPMVPDGDGTEWQINPGHAMLYSALNRMDDYQVDIFVRQFPLVNRIAQEFFGSQDYEDRIILADVDGDPEQGLAKMYHYWRNLLYDLDGRVAGLLQNITRSVRPRLRPDSMSQRLSDGANLGNLSTEEKVRRTQDLADRAQALLNSINENTTLTNKYAALLEMRVSLFEELSNEERRELENILRDLQLLIADAETREAMDPDQLIEIEGTITSIQATLAAEEEPVAPPEPTDGGQDLDEPVDLEPDILLPTPGTEIPTDTPTIPTADANNIVMQDTVIANDQEVDIVLVYRVRENRLDVFRTSGVYILSFGDIGIVQNYRGEERIGGKAIRDGRMVGTSSELSDGNNVLRDGIIEILRDQQRFIDPDTGDLITPTQPVETQPQVGDIATQEQSDRLREISPDDYPMPGEELTQADVDRLTGSDSTPPDVDSEPPAQPQSGDAPSSDAPSTGDPDAPIDGADAPTAPAQPGAGTPPAVGGEPPAQPQPGNRLADQLAAIQTRSLMDDYNAAGRVPQQNVRLLQQGLSQLGMNPGAVDGKYGNNTYAAVQRFQQANGLQVDGEAGPETLAALSRALRNTNESSTLLNRILRLSGL